MVSDSTLQIVPMLSVLRTCMRSPALSNGPEFVSSKARHLLFSEGEGATPSEMLILFEWLGRFESLAPSLR